MPDPAPLPRSPRRGALVVAAFAAATLAVAACSNAAKPASSALGDSPGGAPLTKPVVKPPAAPPTQLVVTDLRAGSGPKAENGSTVVLHYVGVRQPDGAEFDSSYGKGQPFTVTLGKGAVIKGWDEGLIGVQAGTQRRLDIPNDLAYGKTDRGPVIKSGDALTFVVDVLAVVTPPATAPTVSNPKQPNVSEVKIVDEVAGSGPALGAANTAIAHLIAVRADTGEELSSTWQAGSPESIRPDQLLPALGKAMEGMKVGGRRKIQLPFAQAFGDKGNPGLGLPGNVDVIFLIDLFGVY